MGKNRVKINIYGTDYVITSEEEEIYVRAIADEVEKRIAGNMQDNARISVLMSAVLTALDYCDEAKKAIASADNLRSQIKDYLEESSKARMEADEARREIERMKREIQTLRMRLAESDTQPAQAAPKSTRQAHSTQPGNANPIPGRTVAPPAPISRPTPSSSSVPPQARLYTKPEPIGGQKADEVMSFFDRDKADKPDGDK